MKHASCQPPMRLALLFIVVLWSYTTLYTVYSYRSPTISLNDTSDSREVFVADIEWIPSTVQSYASYACIELQCCSILIWLFGLLLDTSHDLLSDQINYFVQALWYEVAPGSTLCKLW